VKRLPGPLVSRYARSLFAAALDQNVLSEVRADLEGLSAVWRENREFVLLVLNPRFSRDKVRAMMDSLGDRLNLQPLTRRFVHLLIEKDRLEMMGQLEAPFQELWRDQQGEVPVTVETALPISDGLKERIRDHLAQRSGRTPVITWNCNPDILGGLVVYWPERVFDGSLARKLENLKRHLAQSA
jgi:F-type H+-transporting ATPase subunit delta